LKTSQLLNSGVTTPLGLNSCGCQRRVCVWLSCCRLDPSVSRMDPKAKGSKIRILNPVAASSHSSLEQLPPEWLKILGHCVGCSRLAAGAAAASGRRSCHASPRFAGQSTAVAPDQGCGQYATGHSGGAHLGRTLTSLPGGYWQRCWINHRTQTTGWEVQVEKEVKVVRRTFWSPGEPTSRPDG